jgi:hypothetical protein
MAGGRPLKFQSVEALESAIAAYFESKPEPVTITGLALALDTSRETLMDYQGKPEYSDAVKRAKLRCEAFAEKMLYAGRNGAAGPIFALKNYGWTDTQHVNLGGQQGNPVEVDVKLSPAEAYHKLLNG